MALSYQAASSIPTGRSEEHALFRAVAIQVEGPVLMQRDAGVFDESLYGFHIFLPMLLHCC